MWPIFQRELLMGARDPVFRHLRVGSGLVAWVGLALLVWSVQGTIGNVGGKIFQIFHVLWACVLLLLSIALTAPVLVSERIGGTLGLLFLTCLRPFEVVGGKGLEALLRMMTLWLSGLPIGMVPFVMGSVTLFDAMFYAAFQFAMVSCGLSAGLVFSAATKDRRSALRGAMGVGLGLATIVLGIWGVFSLPLSLIPVWVRHLVGTIYALGAGGGLLLFTLFVGAAILGRRWREGSDTAPNEPAPDPVEAAEEAQWQHAWREGHGRVMRGRRPLAWLRLREPGRIETFWMWAVGVVVAWVVALALERSWPVEAVGVLLLGLMGMQGSTGYREEAASGALELILTTPMRDRALLWNRVWLAGREFGLAISVHLLLAGWAVRISLFDRGTHPEALFWPALGLWIAPMAGLCVSGTVRSVPLGLFVSAMGTALLPVPGLILRHVVSERTWGGAAVWGMLGLAGILFTLKARELIGSRELALTYLRKP
jgi:hypothetical protein